MDARTRAKGASTSRRSPATLPRGARERAKRYESAFEGHPHHGEWWPHPSLTVAITKLIRRFHGERYACPSYCRDREAHRRFHGEGCACPSLADGITKLIRRCHGERWPCPSLADGITKLIRRCHGERWPCPSLADGITKLIRRCHGERCACPSLTVAITKLIRRPRGERVPAPLERALVHERNVVPPRRMDAVLCARGAQTVRTELNPEAQSGTPRRQGRPR